MEDRASRLHSQPVTGYEEVLWLYEWVERNVTVS